MAHAMDGPRAKIERAKEHVDDLRSALRDFFAGNPYAVTGHVDSQSGEHVLRLVKLADFPPRVSVIIGDVAHNLRSALDHLVWQLVLCNGGTPTFKTEFPIANDADEFEARVATRAKGVGQDALDRLLATNAYRGGDGEVLWRLHRINVSDKHRLLVTVSNVFQEVRSSPDHSTWVVRGRAGDPLFAENGTEFFRTAHDEDDRHVKAVFLIAFGKGEPFAGQPLVPTLGQLVEEVSERIDRFAVLLDR